MKQLIILHGALGSKAQFKQLAGLLSSDFEVHTFNFEGHGGRPTEHPYSIELFTQDLIDYVVAHELNEPYIFGYSMGGYVALNAIANGLNVAGLVTLGTKFEWTPEGAIKETKMLNPNVIEEKVPKFATYQASLHEPEDWKTVMMKTADMMISLGNAPVLTDAKLQSIDLDVLCCLGAEDAMVSVAETQHVIDLLQNGSFHTFDGFEHPIEKVDVDVLQKKIRDQFGSL